jgi:hypothetical protein
MCAAATSAAIVAAAVERSVARDSIVVAIDRSARLTTLFGGGALSSQPDGPAPGRCGGSFSRAAHTVHAPETTAAIDILGAAPAAIAAAVEGAIGINAVRVALGWPRCLAALPALGTLRPDIEATSFVVSAGTVDTVEPAATVSAVANPSARSTLVATAIERAIIFVAVVTAHGRATVLRTLAR